MKYGRVVAVGRDAHVGRVRVLACGALGRVGRTQTVAQVGVAPVQTAATLTGRPARGGGGRDAHVHTVQPAVQRRVIVVG